MTFDTVGCMLNRYSLDVEGLAFAGGEWDSSKYSTILYSLRNFPGGTGYADIVYLPKKRGDYDDESDVDILNNY